MELLIRKLADNDRMDLLVDCPSAPDDVPEVVKALGGTVPEVSRLGSGEWRIVIVKRR